MMVKQVHLKGQKAGCLNYQSATIVRFGLFGATLFCSALWSTSAMAKDHWVQIHVDVEYTRTYAFARNDKDQQESSQSSFTLTGTLDQMMWRMDPESGDKYPTYYFLEESPKSFKSNGTVALTAQMQSEDRLSKRRDNASATLRGVLKNWDDFHIEKMMPESMFGVALFAEIKWQPTLTGSVQSTLPVLPGTSKEDTVLIWAPPLAFDSELKTFKSDLLAQVRTPMGPRPKDEMMARVYDLQMASSNLSDLAQIGGAALSLNNAVIQGGMETWTLTSSLTREVPVTSDRGSYQESIRLTIKPVSTSLTTPPNPPN